MSLKFVKIYSFSSKTYREFLHKNNIELTPRQIAKLIHQYDKTYESRWNAYQQLKNDPRTEGDLLENLKTIIAYEKPFVEQNLKKYQMLYMF